MDDWFCKSRNHRREAHLRADDLAQLKCALSRARFGDVFFPLTEDLHGCPAERSSAPARFGKRYIPPPPLIFWNHGFGARTPAKSLD